MEEKKTEATAVTAAPKKKKKKVLIILGVIAFAVIALCLASVIELKVRTKKFYDRVIIDNMIAEEYDIVYFEGKSGNNWIYSESGTVSIKPKKDTGYVTFNLAGDHKMTLSGVCGFIKSSKDCYYFAQKGSKDRYPDSNTNIWIYPSTNGEILYLRSVVDNFDLGGGLSFKEMVLRKSDASFEDFFDLDKVKTDEAYKNVNISESRSTTTFAEPPVIKNNYLELAIKEESGVVSRKDYGKTSDGKAFELKSGNDKVGYGRTTILLLTEHDYCYIIEESSTAIFINDKKGFAGLFRN